MEIITSNYQQFKQALDSEIQHAAEGFVKIGYLLRFARDNAEILAGSGYQSITEMAAKEYGIDASQVSRFIAINERFSEGGYSEKLETHYEGFGVAKLSIMLQLPDNLNAELTPDFTKSEINSLREEVKEESKISDIEVLCEPTENSNMTELQKIALEVIKDPATFAAIHKADEGGHANVEYLRNILAPAGVAVKSIRLSGTGKIMVKIDESSTVKLIFVRTNETKEVTFEDLMNAIRDLAWGQGTIEEDYKNLYDIDYPKAEEPVAKSTKIAPVQKVTKTPKPDKPKKVEKVKEEDTEIMPPPEAGQKVVDEPAKPDEVYDEKPAEEPVMAAGLEPEEPEEETEDHSSTDSGEILGQQRYDASDIYRKVEDLTNVTTKWLMKEASKDYLREYKQKLLNIVEEIEELING